MSALRSALAALGLATDEPTLSGERDAIVLGEYDGDVATSSLIPLRIAYDSPWDVGVVDGALVVHAMDRRRAGFVRVEDGGIAHRLARRRARVRGMWMEGDPPWLYWVTPADQCPEGCARRSTGLAAFMEDQQTLEPMFWLNGHPRGVPESALDVRPQQVLMVAVGLEGAEVRRFSTPEPEVRELGASSEALQIAAESVMPLALFDDTAVHWLSSGGLWFGGVAQLGVFRLETGEIERGAPTSLPAAAQRIVSCYGDGGEFVLITTAAGAVLHRIGEPALRVLAFDPVPAFAGAARVVCDRSGAIVYAIADENLVAQRCGPSTCDAPTEIAADVAAFDVAVVGGETVLVYTDDVEHGAITAIDARGRAVVGPCWEDPTEGMCGAPRLATDGSVVYVIARQEGDLRALHRTPEGWEPLEGLATE